MAQGEILPLLSTARDCRGIASHRSLDLRRSSTFKRKQVPFGPKSLLSQVHFQKSVTLRKNNIFRWDFFKTISTRSENSISGVFQRCSATKKKLWTIKVVKQGSKQFPYNRRPSKFRLIMKLLHMKNTVIGFTIQ